MNERVHKHLGCVYFGKKRNRKDGPAASFKIRYTFIVFFRSSSSGVPKRCHVSDTGLAAQRFPGGVVLFPCSGGELFGAGWAGNRLCLLYKGPVKYT